MTTQRQSPLRLVLIGGGGHALVVHEAALAMGMSVSGVYDDDAKCSLTVRTQARNLGSPSQIVGFGDAAWIVGVGSITLRRNIIDRLDALSASARSGLTNIVHPRAHVSPTATLGHTEATGVYVGPMACIHAYARVGPHCIINTGAIVEHECDLESNVHVAPNATLGGTVAVGTDTLIGIGATVLPGVKIGRGCVIGAGAVVRHNVKDGATVVGVPAR